MIMQIEDQVVNLELSRRLKELGVRQKSLFYWGYYQEPVDKNPTPPRIYLFNDPRKYEENHLFSAFTVAELGLMLPDGCGTLRDWDSGFTVYCYEKSEDGKTFINHYHTTDTEADARAKAIIYLIENKLLKL
jgi:hypothetical protein